MIDDFLSRLKKVHGRNGRWTACCPAHNDKSPSLAVRELDDGRILVKCFSGCSAAEIVASVGMDLTDLFPPDDSSLSYRTKPAKSERKPFYPSDLLKITRFEALIVAMVARDITKGKNVSESDLERLNVAFERICAVVGEIDEKYA